MAKNSVPEWVYGVGAGLAAFFLLKKTGASATVGETVGNVLGTATVGLGETLANIPGAWAGSIFQAGQEYGANVRESALKNAVDAGNAGRWAGVLGVSPPQTVTIETGRGWAVVPSIQPTQAPDVPVVLGNAADYFVQKTVFEVQDKGLLGSAWAALTNPANSPLVLAGEQAIINLGLVSQPVVQAPATPYYGPTAAGLSYWGAP